MHSSSMNVFNCSIVCGFLLKTSFLRKPHKKKSGFAKSGDRAGHRNGPFRPIQRPMG